MNISLQENMKTFVDEQVQCGGYGSAGEDIRDLVRRGQKCRAEAQLEQLLVAGFDGKNVPITETVNLRLSLDTFNALNQPGLNLPGGDGILSLRTSAQGARTMQYTARFTW